MGVSVGDCVSSTVSIPEEQLAPMHWQSDELIPSAQFNVVLYYIFVCLFVALCVGVGSSGVAPFFVVWWSRKAKRKLWTEHITSISFLCAVPTRVLEGELN